MAGYKDVFGTDEEFRVIMETVKNQPLQTYQEEVNRALEYAIGVNIDNYKNLLCGE